MRGEPPVEDSRWLERPDARLRYRIGGNAAGRPVLLVHEMGGALESWDGVVAALGSDWRCLRADQRGMGLSSPISGTASLDDLVADQLAVWETASLGRPAIVAASALGCAVAVALAARHPSLVSGLVLLAPALGVPPERSAGVRAMADMIEAEGVEAVADPANDAAFPQRFREGGGYVTYLAVQRRNAPASYAAYWRMLASIDLTNEIGVLDTPAVILAGAADVIRPPDQVARLPGAEFRIVDSGHFMALQTPQLVADAITHHATITHRN